MGALCSSNGILGRTSFFSGDGRNEFRGVVPSLTLNRVVVTVGPGCDKETESSPVRYDHQVVE